MMSKAWLQDREKRYLICLVIVFLFLTLGTHFLMNGVTPLTIFVSEQPAILLEYDTGPIVWTETFDVDIDFHVIQLFAVGAQVRVDSRGEFESRVEGDGSRLTTVSYTFYCNAQIVTTALYAYNVSGSSGGAGFHDIELPTTSFSAGTNQLVVHGALASSPLGDAEAFFAYQIDVIQVQVNYHIIGIALPYAIGCGIIAFIVIAWGRTRR